MTQLLAYKNDPLLKAGIIASIKKKIAAGMMEHGTYGTLHDDGVTRGCAVFLATCQTHDAHSYAEREYRIPRELYQYLDRIFEGLENSPPKDREWPVKFHEAIPVGADTNGSALQIARDVIRNQVD